MSLGCALVFASALTERWAAASERFWSGVLVYEGGGNPEIYTVVVTRDCIDQESGAGNLNRAIVHVFNWAQQGWPLHEEVLEVLHYHLRLRHLNRFRLKLHSGGQRTRDAIGQG